MAQPDDLDLTAAADALSVHYQTAYRWVRSGQLPARVEKGAYRVARRDVEQLQTDGTASRRARRVRPSPRSTERTRRLVTEALVAGDERAVRTTARTAVAAASITAVLDHVVAPAMCEVGRLWELGMVPIWTEHRATAIVGRMLGDVATSRPGRRRGTAVVTTVAGEQHALPAEMAVAALREDNWLVHHLGADIPTDDIVDFCRRHPVGLAVITVTMEDHAALADEVQRRLAPVVPRVLVGGCGRSLADLQRLARGLDPISSGPGRA